MNLDSTLTRIPVRAALVTGRADDLARVVRRALPDNYRVIATLVDGSVLVTGTDVVGWTLEDYVIPRLGSFGGLGVKEVTREGVMGY